MCVFLHSAKMYAEITSSNNSESRIDILFACSLMLSGIVIRIMRVSKVDQSVSVSVCS